RLAPRAPAGARAEARLRLLRACPAAALGAQPAGRPGGGGRDDGERAGRRPVRGVPLLVPALPGRGRCLASGPALRLQAVRDGGELGVLRVDMPEHDRVLVPAEDVVDPDVVGPEPVVGVVDVVRVREAGAERDGDAVAWKDDGEGAPCRGV